MDSKLMAGTVEMLILEVVSQGSSYGYAIVQSVTASSRGDVDLKEGSLYPALHRMERRELLSSSWRETEEGRRRKYYKITPAGLRMLEKKKQEWFSFTGAVGGVLGSRMLDRTMA